MEPCPFPSPSYTLFLLLPSLSLSSLLFNSLSLVSHPVWNPLLQIPLESLWERCAPQERWRRQDLLRGGAKIEIMSWGTHGGLRGRVQQLLDD